jgi:hypothetical protein
MPANSVLSRNSFGQGAAFSTQGWADSYVRIAFQGAAGM